MIARLVCLLALLAIAASARAETLVMTVSSKTIPITSNFTGADMSLFGAIERDGASISRAGDYDVVVVIRGPKGQVVVREKNRWGPFWLNLDQRRYIAVPAYIAVLSNRALDRVAEPGMLRRLGLGVDPLVVAQGRRGEIFDPEEPDFRQALIRLRRADGLFVDLPRGVEFLSPTIFRASVRLPGIVPIGRYEVDVTVLAEGVPLARASDSFTVLKHDVEQRVATLARERAWLYGLAAAAMAVLIGWLATQIFRRD